MVEPQAYTPGGGKYRDWTVDELARYQEIDPAAREELHARLAKSVLPDVMAKTSPEMQALRAAEPEVTRPDGPTGLEKLAAAAAEYPERVRERQRQVYPQGMTERAGPGGIEAIKGAMPSMPGMPGMPQIPAGDKPGWQVFADLLQNLQKNPMANPPTKSLFPGSAAPGGPAAGSVRAAQQMPLPEEPSGPDKWLAKWEDWMSTIGKGSEASAAAPVPGPKPGVPQAPMPQVPGPGIMPPPGMAVGPSIDIGAPQPQHPPISPATMAALAQQPGGDSFLSKLDPSKWNDLTRFGLQMMAKSGPRQNRTPGLLEVVGDAGVETLQSTDKRKLTEADERFKAAEAEKNRQVTREGHDVTRAGQASRERIAERREFMNAESKTLDRQVRLMGMRTRDAAAVSKVRKDYSELIANAASDEEAAQLKVERDQKLKELGVTPSQVRKAVDQKSGKTLFYEIGPDGTPRRIQ